VYEQERSAYHRRGFEATRGRTHYTVEPAMVKVARQRFSHIVDIPRDACNVHFYAHELPERYRSALQDVR
jgi:hypothetical protein